MKTNHQLRQDIERQLAREKALDDSHIMVAVRDGAVSGTVSSLAEKRAAILAASDAPGAAKVESELQVSSG